MNGRPTDPRRHLAAKVARLQAERGFSAESLAARARLDLEELERILRGEAPVALDVIFLLAGALEVEPGELLGGLAWVPDGEGGGEYRDADPGQG
jgi:transcriptional regulator with XRE-family HTH domain